MEISVHFILAYHKGSRYNMAWRNFILSGQYSVFRYIYMRIYVDNTHNHSDDIDLDSSWSNRVVLEFSRSISQTNNAE